MILILILILLADNNKCEPLLPKTFENDGVHCRITIADPVDHGSGTCDRGRCVSLQRSITDIPDFEDLFKNFSIANAVRYALNHLDMFGPIFHHFPP